MIKFVNVSFMESGVKMMIGEIGSCEIPLKLVLPEVVGSNGLGGLFKFPFNIVTISKHKSSISFLYSYSFFNILSS